MRICLVYDCVYPYTIGGAERWYRSLADQLLAAGHEVTYLTRKQWSPDHEPEVPGVRVVAVSPGGPLYTDGGRRRILPPLRFGLGVLLHLLRNRGRYDAIHLVSFPYFPVIAVRLAARGADIGIDWFEVWSRNYWREYVGRLAGAVGYAVQRLCVRLTPRAFVFSALHARRLREENFRGELVRLSGLYAGDASAAEDADAERPALVLFAGRHIAEKRAHLIPAAVAAARKEIPDLRGLILGDGPERERVLRAIDEAGVADVVDAPGFVKTDEVDAAFRRASCHVLPSRREGYGMVVIEAAAHGTPSVVVAEDDNAAAELIENGVNGFVVPSVDALADGIVAVQRGGAELRRRTAEWFEANVGRLSAAESAARIVEVYARDGECTSG